MEKEIIKDVDISEIIPYEKNFQNHDKNIEYIKNSLGTFGYLKPSIVIDEENVLLCGHGTLEAMKQLRWNIIPEVVKIKGLTKKQKSAYRIADNTSANDVELYYDNLDHELELIGFEYNLVDFGLDDITHDDLTTENIEIKPYVRSHILLSFPPEKISEIEKYLKNILDDPLIEIEYGAN